MKLQIRIKGDSKEIPGNKFYSTEVNAKNYKELAIILIDLKNLNIPIEKAIKEFNLSKSDWEAALGL